MRNVRESASEMEVVCHLQKQGFQKLIRLESRRNKAFQVVPVENIREQRNSRKGDPVTFFPSECSKRKFAFNFLKPILIPGTNL